jgi:hypothetical protein
MSANTNYPAQAQTTRTYAQEESHRITITDIQIPFWRLVGFLIKFSIASIPAAIAVSIIILIAFGCLSALGLGSLAALFGGGSGN